MRGGAAPISLLGHDRPESVVAFRNGEPVTAAHFLADVAALAERLPRRGHVVNGCIDRYRFAVGLAAALTREQVSLLLPSDAPGLMEQIAEQYPDLYYLTDGTAMPGGAIDAVAYPEALPVTLAAAAVPAFAAEQRAALVFTSGSTGRPMPNLKSWGAMAASARAAGARLGVAALSGAALLGTVPQQHMYGLESTVLLALQQGLALCAGRPFYPADVCAALEALPRPRILVTTPIHLRALLADGGRVPVVDAVLCATAPLAPALARDAEARFGAPLHEIYGCSEAGQVAVRRPVETEIWRCLDGFRLRQDGEGTWVTGAGAGEVLLQDVIELIDDERFRLQGRTADLVNIAGKRTSLAHLNHHLTAIAGVADGVFVAPEEAGGDVTRLAAFVVAPGLDAAAILGALRQRIDAAFLPRPLYFVTALPRNATGKLSREALRRLAAEFAAR